MQIKWIGAATGNWLPGRLGYKPDSITVHLTDANDHKDGIAGTDAWFNNPIAKVTAHYCVPQDGKIIHQYVKEEDRAFHAGRVDHPSFSGVSRHKGINPNLWTIGIEHEGKPEDAWPAEMMQSSAELISAIAQRWGIPLDRDHICGHHEIFSLKVCPGPHCDLDQLIKMAIEVSSRGAS